MLQPPEAAKDWLLPVVDPTKPSRTSLDWLRAVLPEEKVVAVALAEALLSKELEVSNPEYSAAYTTAIEDGNVALIQLTPATVLANEKEHSSPWFTE